MATTQAGCTVLTFKEGLLSRVAHDLKIVADRFEVAVADGRITATVDAASLRVVCAMSDGRESPGTLGAGDLRKIEQNMADDVLEARRHPRIRFQSDPVAVQGDTARIEGTLSLHGVDRRIATEVRRAGGVWRARLVLHQPDWGIRPFTALMGTLRVRPDVEVHVEVPDREEWHG